MKQVFATRWAAVVMVVAMVAAAGRTIAQAQSATSAPSDPVITAAATQSEVAQVAWTDLQLLRDYVHSSRERNTEEQRGKYSQVRKALTAASYLGPQVPASEVEQIATLWPAIVSHYVDGLQRETLVVVQPNEHEAIATIRAANPKDKKIAEKLSAGIRKTLEEQGLSGRHLLERQKVLLKRELADQGIGLPLIARIQLRLVKVEGQWKLRGVSLIPPSGLPATGPASRPVRSRSGSTAQ